MIKNLLITFGLSLTLIIFSLFVFMPKSEAQSNNILPQLIELPAPPPPNPLVRNLYGTRSEEFYNQENPPSDDAPIEDLLAYWERQNGLNAVYSPTIKPSDRVLDRILAEIEKNPEIVSSYLNVLSEKPDAADAVKRMYDRILSKEENKYKAGQLKNWLTYNSDFFSDELLQIAEQVKDTDDYVTNQEELLALAKVDWEKARPLLERMVNDSSQPISQTLANWAFYLHTLKKGNSLEAGTYRDALMKTVEDKNSMPGNRDLALDALVYGGDFAGRDDWYFSLLEDETLFDLRVGGRSYTGLTTLLMRSPSDKLIDKMIELVGSSNQNVRNAAARNLTTVLRKNDPKVIKALLPWLENPNWAKQIGNERNLVVRALSQVEIPESVPGLIAILNEKRTVEVDEYEDFEMNSNMMNSNKMSSDGDAPPMPPPPPMPRGMMKREQYPYRDAAIDALIKQRSLQAAAALRQILPEVAQWKRDDVVRAILLSGGFTIPEQTEALEIKAREVKEQQAELEKIQASVNTEDYDEDEMAVAVARTRIASIATNSMSSSRSRGETFNPADIKPMLGEQLVNIEEPSNELVSAVTYRLNSLDKTEPQIAEIIRSFMQNWKGAAVNAILLNDLAEGKSDLNVIVKLLSLRKELREKQITDIYNARSKGNPIALGISACLLENNSDYSGILASGTDDAKIALLGCARLIRAPLSVQTVANFLKSSNKTLALAAERYIESEDSPSARQIIYAKYPNEAKITGATFFFGEGKTPVVRPDFLSNLFGSVGNSMELPPYYFYMAMAQQDDSTEEKLKKEVKEDEKILGIYAYDKNYVRIYQDKAVFSWEEDEARYFERKLNESEFGYLKSFLASNDVNNLPPFVSYCGGCVPKELLMLGKQGGRRVFVFTNPQPQFFEGLEKIFEDMRKPSAKLRYWLEKDIAGLEILFADKDLEAKTVWKNGDDLRVLINNTNREEQVEKELNKLAAADQENENLDYEQADELDRKRRMQRAFESYSWHKFAGNKLGDFTNQPAGVGYITQGGGSSRNYESGNRYAKSGNIEIRVLGEELYKVVNGQMTKIKMGYYMSPVISADGRWVVLSKYLPEEDKVSITRINLQNNKEFPVKIDTKHRFSKPSAYIPTANKILIITGNLIDYDRDSIKNGTYYLLDPETGAAQPTKGEFRPLGQQTFRELQKTANADEVWAAIPEDGKKETQIGIYNTKTFDFKSVLTVPQISFDSMDMWVDEAANKVYVVYNGQLLSIPLKKESSEPEKIN